MLGSLLVALPGFESGFRAGKVEPTIKAMEVEIQKSQE